MAITNIHIDAVGGIAGDMFIAAMLDLQPELLVKCEESIDLMSFSSRASVRLKSFNENSYAQLIKQIKLLEKISRPIGYIIDLRNYPGGLLNQAISITDYFLEDGEIVSTKGRKLSETEFEPPRITPTSHYLDNQSWQNTFGVYVPTLTHKANATAIVNGITATQTVTKPP